MFQIILVKKIKLRFEMWILKSAVQEVNSEKWISKSEFETVN